MSRDHPGETVENAGTRVSVDQKAMALRFHTKEYHRNSSDLIASEIL